MTLSRSDLRVRTLRVATGAHFLSFVTGPDASGPTLPEELERLPPSADLVINVEGLDSDGARAVAAVLKESGRGRQSPGDTIIVAEKESVRRVLRRSGVGRQLLIEHSLDDAVRYVLGRALLETDLLGGQRPLTGLEVRRSDDEEAASIGSRGRGRDFGTRRQSPA